MTTIDGRWQSCKCSFRFFVCALRKLTSTSTGQHSRYEKRVRLPSSPTDPKSYTYHFVGYTSLYPFLHYPDKTRLRLSQFFILPPYQHQFVTSCLICRLRFGSDPNVRFFA